MARYDRIARIDPPEREDAYDGWLSMRDLEGREREPELGRRAMARFLALRPVRRLLARGLDGPAGSSFSTQIEAVRKQIEQLPRGHVERERLSHYLEEIGGRAPAGMVRATLEVGASAEAAGHLFAAEEFYRTALELAEAHDLTRPRITALRDLARVQRERGELDAAMASLEESARLAESAQAPVEWARSVEAMTGVLLRQGRVDEARAALRRITTSEHAREDAVRAIAATGECALELVQGHPEEAVDVGWTAVRLLEPGDEARNRVLLNMAAGFRRLGLGGAAASCYEIVVRWSAWPEHRIEARLEHALVAAEAGDAEAFAERRDRVLDALGDADRPLEAMVHLGLGRGEMLLGDDESARTHLREAISIARDVGAQSVLHRAEDLLDSLEESLEAPLAGPAAEPTEDVLVVAGRIEDLALNDGS